MKLNLIDARQNAGFFFQPINMLRKKITDSDGFYITTLLRFNQSLPCLDIKSLFGIGPVDVIEVIIIEPGAIKRFLNGQDGFVKLMMTTGKFGRNPQIPALVAAFTNSFSYRAFILVIEGAIQSVYPASMALFIPSTPGLPFNL